MGKRKQRSISVKSVRYKFIMRFGKAIEEFESFKRATEGYSKMNFNSTRRALPFYFLFLDENPDEVIEHRKQDIASEDVTENENYERKTNAYLKDMLNSGFAGRTVQTHLGRVQGFFNNNAHKLALNMRNTKIPKGRKRTKYSPSNEQVRILFNRADSSRDKLIVSIMYQNGPTPIDLSLMTCGDYPIEPWVYFERSRAKTGEVWHSVSMPDVCECLKNYLNLHVDYKSSDPLFISREGPLDGSGISQIMHGLISSVPELKVISGFKPTSLRDAFEDALVEAEIYHKIKEALMAHNSGIEQQYGGHNKMVQHLVVAMKKVYPLVALTNQQVNVDSDSRLGKLEKDNSVMKKKIEKFEKMLEGLNRWAELPQETLDNLERNQEE